MQKNKETEIKVIAGFYFFFTSIILKMDAPQIILPRSTHIVHAILDDIGVRDCTMANIEWCRRQFVTLQEGLTDCLKQFMRHYFKKLQFQPF